MCIRDRQEPVRQIAKNAGVDGSVVLEKIKSSRKVGYGFDAYKEVDVYKRQPLTSFTMRRETVSSSSHGRREKSAVMKSCVRCV